MLTSIFDVLNTWAWWEWIVIFFAWVVCFLVGMLNAYVFNLVWEEK